MMTDEFPQGATLIGELIDLHRTTEDEHVTRLIELEIATTIYQMVEVAEPTALRLQDCAVTDLLDFHKLARSKSGMRRIRLCLFDKLGAFDEAWEERPHDDTPGGVLEALTFEEVQYLSQSTESPLIEQCTSQEFSRRTRESALDG